MRKPLVLAILDGWGYRPERDANAIAQARKPNYDRLLREFPNTLLHASDHFVGLPDGQMGNSEVGHLNIGAGRVVSMDITRIDAMIANGSFYEHPEIVRAIDRACEEGRQLHLLGLLSNGGVHSQQAHLHALLRAQLSLDEGTCRVQRGRQLRGQGVERVLNGVARQGPLAGRQRQATVVDQFLDRVADSTQDDGVDHLRMFTEGIR